MFIPQETTVAPTSYTAPGMFDAAPPILAKMVAADGHCQPCGVSDVAFCVSFCVAFCVAFCGVVGGVVGGVTGGVLGVAVGVS